MSSHTIRETEDPRHFVQRHAPRMTPKEIVIICPVQGREQNFYDANTRSYVDFSAAKVAAQDEPNIPGHFKLVEKEAGLFVYSAANFDIFGLLKLLRDRKVHVLSAYETWPGASIPNPYPLDETEDPKRLLHHFSSQKIWPSENYFLCIWKSDERWRNGEFCPCQVNEHNELMLFDAIYGLDDDIFEAMGIVGRDPTSEEEDRFDVELHRYEDPIYAAIKQGVTSGTVEGIAGQRNWQLVHDPSREKSDLQLPHSNWADHLQVIRPGEIYGPRITPKTDRSRWIAFGGDIDPNAAESQAVVLAQALLDGEDPRDVFNSMERGPTVPVLFYHLNPWNGEETAIATGLMRSDGRLVPVDNALPTLEPGAIAKIYRALRRGQLSGTCEDTGPELVQWRIAGRKAYGTSAKDKRIAKFVNNTAPTLTVATSHWAVQFPIYLNRRQGVPTVLFWQATPGQRLAPEVKEFLHRYSDEILTEINEGDLERDLYGYDENVVGRFEVNGAVDNAPYADMPDEWSGY